MLPWKRSTEKIDEDICKGFEVVASRLFDPRVGIQRDVACCTSQTSVCLIRDMKVCCFIAIFFCKSKIDDVDYMRFVIQTNKKVFGLDVAVNIILRMDIFNTRNLAVK